MPSNQSEDEANQPRLEDLITLAQAAKISGHTSRHLGHLARNGDLWGHKIGHIWVTTEKAVREYLARENRPGPKSK